MLIYQCKKCEVKKELNKVVMKIIDGKVCNLGTECPKCGEYMREIEKKFDGFPSLKRTEPTLSNKNNKLWSRAKDTLIN